MLDQVFTGIYDATPNLTRGCTLAGACLVSTIYGPTPPAAGTNLATATNSTTEAGDNVVSNGVIGAAFDTTPIAAVTVALWTAVKPAQIPEPSSLGLMLTALVGLSIARRRRSR